MFIQSKVAFRFKATNGTEKATKSIPAQFVGEVEDWVTKTLTFIKAVESHDITFVGAPPTTIITSGSPAGALTNKTPRQLAAEARETAKREAAEAAEKEAEAAKAEADAAAAEKAANAADAGGGTSDESSVGNSTGAPPAEQQ